MKKEIKYLDIHILQTVPPSCVNRDDTGSPKTAIYGGAMRARVSSQSWKRAVRVMFKDMFPPELIGYRTREIPNLISEKICKIDDSINIEKATKIVESIIKLIDIPEDVLFLISSLQIEEIAKLALEYDNDDLPKKEKDKNYKPLLNNKLLENPSVDMVLFGRMSATNQKLNYDAASQVSHAISTHRINNEYDYFTAVDDCNEDNAGAGHLGTVEFNSSTLYRYANVNLSELEKHFGVEQIKTAILGFIKAFVVSMPTGKQNTFANRTLPDMIYVTLRTDQPVNLAGAFEKPVVSNDGYVKKSKEALKTYANDVYKMFVDEPYKAWTVGYSDGELGEDVNLKELLIEIEKELDQYNNNEGE